MKSFVLEQNKYLEQSKLIQEKLIDVEKSPELMHLHILNGLIQSNPKYSIGVSGDPLTKQVSISTTNNYSQDTNSYTLKLEEPSVSDLEPDVSEPQPTVSDLFSISPFDLNFDYTSFEEPASPDALLISPSAFNLHINNIKFMVLRSENILKILHKIDIKLGPKSAQLAYKRTSDEFNRRLSYFNELLDTFIPMYEEYKNN